MRIDRTAVQLRAEKLATQGKIPAAIAEYRTLLKEQPEDLNTINRLGDLLVRDHKLPEAIELFARGSALYVKGGFFLKAIAVYKKILKLDPQASECRLRLAELYARRDLVPDAAAEYLEAASQFMTLGQRPKAKDVYERLVKIEPGNVAARLALADLAASSGDRAKGVAELAAAGSDLERLGFRDGAAEIQQRILKQPSAEVVEQAQAVKALARLGLGSEAVVAGQALCRRAPGDREAVESLVEALELAGRPAEAEELVSATIGDEAHGAIVRVVRGRLYGRAGDLRAAAPMLLNAAKDLQSAKLMEHAAAALDSLLGFDPANREALEQRLDVARAMRDEDTADLLSERLMVEFGEFRNAPVRHEPAPEEMPAVPDSRPPEPVLTREDRDFLSEHLTEAEVFVKYGLFEKAVGPLKQVLERFPDHIEAHQRLKTIFTEQGNRIRVVEQCLFLAEIHEGRGEASEALKVLGEAGNLDPDNPVVTAWLVRLSASAGGALDGAPGSSEARTAKGTRADERMDLAGEFGATLADALRTESPLDAEPEEEQGVEEVLKAFRERVDQVVSGDDYGTLYDLAIAYKEMGLLDEAISQFEAVAKDPSRFVECCSMLGICLREKQQPARARAWYLAALESGRTDGARRLGLLFDLGETYLELGEHERARAAFEQVAAADPDYRDVAARLESALKPA